MPTQRRIARTITLPPPGPGFIGRGHSAVEVVTPRQGFAATDPFILLMDDRLDLEEMRVGEAHPHAGIETVTLVIDGSLHDRDEGGLDAGDAQWMTAGRGIIHGEDVMARGATRVLQLWVTLPKSERLAQPRFQNIHLADIPIRREPGVELRLYSGSSGGLDSPTLNHVPVMVADIRLDAGAAIDHDLPASYNGFLYLLEGKVLAGEDGAPLSAGQTGWLDRPAAGGASTLRIVGGDGGGRVVLYAGEPQNVPIVLHGPFAADTKEEIVRFYEDYRAGLFTRMSELAAGTA
jgi:redox-sensitive bicupin YhaK (pirin superfamily)